MRVKKINQLSQVHGQDESDLQVTTLDQLFGDTGLAKYGTMKEDEYIGQLNDMNKSDLQAHASKVGLVPIDDRERLTKRLVHEFRLYVASYIKRPVKKNVPTKITPEVAKILAEGR